MTFQLRIRKEPDIKGTAENIPGRNNSKSDGNKLGFSEKQPGGQRGWRVVSEGLGRQEEGAEGRKPGSRVWILFQLRSNILEEVTRRRTPRGPKCAV